MSAKADWIRATLEPVILETIAAGATYGYDISRAIQSASSGQLLAQEGTLYPALHRLEKRGLLKATWKLSPEGRRRKHYSLTNAGRRQLEASRAEWASFSKTVNQILGIVHVGVASA
jgi:PadR family transcriptional regulator, regulatory protein PadR